MTLTAADATPAEEVAVCLTLAGCATWPDRVAWWGWTPAAPWLAELAVVCSRPGKRGGSAERHHYYLEADGHDWLFLPVGNPDGDIYRVRRSGQCTCPAGRAGLGSCKHAAAVAAARAARVIG